MENTNKNTVNDANKTLTSVVNADAKRKSVFETFASAFSKSQIKEVKNTELIADFVGFNEKGTLSINSKGLPTSAKSRDLYELIHVHAKDTGKQLFYIYISTKTIQFKITPKVETGLFQIVKKKDGDITTGIKDGKLTVGKTEIVFSFRKHHEHRCYTVSPKDAPKLMELLLKGITTYNTTATQTPKETATQTLKEETIAQ